jgi:transposase
MRETITMTTADQQRAWVLTKVLCDELTVHEAAALLDLSDRSVWRLRSRFAAEGPAALVHGNRGRASARRVGEAVRAKVIGLARTTYAGANDTHLAELLAEHEGIELSRVTVRRILRADGIPSPRKRRAPRHRSRRDRMPQAGLLVQVDGSRHDWLEDRGPRLTLVGGIDDATGILTAATFRDQEDTAGYLRSCVTPPPRASPAGTAPATPCSTPSLAWRLRGSSPTPGAAPGRALEELAIT